jgi:hypothetical protein
MHKNKITDKIPKPLDKAKPNPGQRETPEEHVIETLHHVDQDYRPAQQEYTHDQDRPFQDLSHSRHTRDSEHYGGGGMSNAFEYGEHTGKGPKGYSRSDERIRDDVCEALTQHGEIDASDVEVKVHAGAVTLTGTVDSRVTKQLAEEAIERLAGVKEVINRLKVLDSQ